MKLRRIKLIWGASKVIRGRWFFGLIGFYDRAQGKREDGFAISVRGVLLWAGALGAVLYVAGALALASFWQRNPYSLLTFSDALLYPVRRAEVAEKKGQAFIAEGSELCKAGKWADGARLLARGLVLFPRDLRAQLTLARFHVAANQRETAVRILRSGLTDEYPGRSYLEGLFEIAEQAEDLDLIVTTAQRYLPLLAGAATLRDRRWLAARKFAALLTAKRAAEALVFAQTEDPGEIANEHRVLALIELRRAGEAAAFLGEWAARPGADQKQILRLKVRVLREAGRIEEMAEALGAMRQATSGDPRTLVYAIVQWAMAGQSERARMAFEDYLFRFGGAAANLQLVAEPLAEIGERVLVERCVAAAAERGYPAAPLRVLLVQVLVRNGAWPEAAAELARSAPAPGVTPPPAEKIWREWNQLMIDAARAPTDGTQAALAGFLRERPWSAKIFRRTIEAMRRTGRRELVLDLLGIAIGSYPASVWFKEQREEIKREIAQAEAKPVPVAAAVDEPRFQAGEQDFFEELDGLLRAGKWEEAERKVRAQRNRRSRLPWFEARDGDLRLVDVRINQGRGDRAAMLASAGVYLNGDADRSRRMMIVAGMIAEAGDRASAVALLESVLNKTPEFPGARRLLREWKMPAGASKK